MKKAIIIQARIGSTRLPGKVFKELCGQKMLLHVINRLKFCKLADKIIIATTTLTEDDRVERFCLENNIPYYRGSSDDVLSRYFEAAKVFGADIIIRITSDCPVIDPVIIDNMIEEFVKINKNEKLDYLSNSIVRTFPRGLDAEIFSFEALEKSYNEAELQYEREHVTPYIYQHPELFSIKNYAGSNDYSSHRWTVDTPEDFSLIEKVYNELYKTGEVFLLEDIIKLFEKNPDWLKINQDIKQKNLGE